MSFAESNQRAPGHGARPRGSAHIAHRRSLHTILLVLSLVLAACGEEETPAPTPRPDGVPTVAGDATVDDERSVVVGSPVASPGGGALTLGELSDRMEAAWLGVRTVRAVFVSGPAAGSLASPVSGPPTAGSPAASPGVPPPTIEVTREAVLPDRQRQVIRGASGVESEAVAVGGRVYVRGDLAAELRPGVDADTWVEVDPATFDPTAEPGQALAGLTAPITSPTAAIPPNLRPQELRPLGSVSVAGRTCQAYGAAATTETGGRIDLTIAVGPDNLPCFVETRSGGVVSRVTYEAFNEPLTIEPPATAVPAASPVALGTPIGRD